MNAHFIYEFLATNITYLKRLMGDCRPHTRTHTQTQTHTHTLIHTLTRARECAYNHLACTTPQVVDGPSGSHLLLTPALGGDLFRLLQVMNLLFGCVGLSQFWQKPAHTELPQRV